MAAEALLWHLRNDCSGASVHPSIAVQRDAFGGLGLYMAGEQTALRHEELLCIPRTCMLECPAGVSGPMQCAALALALLHEQVAGPDSKLASYLSCLPSAEDLACMPTLWHFEELQQQDEQQGDLPAATLVQQLLQASPSSSAAFDSLCHQLMNEYASYLPKLAAHAAEG